MSDAPEKKSEPRGLSPSEWVEKLLPVVGDTNPRLQPWQRELFDRLWKHRLKEGRPLFFSTRPGGGSNWFFDLYMRGHREKVAYAQECERKKPDVLIVCDEVAEWPWLDMHVGVDVGSELGDHTAIAIGARQCGKTELRINILKTRSVGCSFAGIKEATHAAAMSAAITACSSEKADRYEPENPKAHVPFYKKFQPKWKLR